MPRRSYRAHPAIALPERACRDPDWSRAGSAGRPTRPDEKVRRSGASRSLIGVFGLTLAAMNLAFYESLERIPLGVAVTFARSADAALSVLDAGRR